MMLTLRKNEDLIMEEQRRKQASIVIAIKRTAQHSPARKAETNGDLLCPNLQDLLFHTAMQA